MLKLATSAVGALRARFAIAAFLSWRRDEDGFALVLGVGARRRA